ncbi:MAG: hypothetical protein HY270_21050 [Deltaproteobacteria bacterium]|nr:hypothetical protein [Deltaproteobacteria bacterium]
MKVGVSLKTGKLNEPRYAHTATLLSGDHVLVAGGEGPEFHVFSSSELYDPTPMGGCSATPQTCRQSLRQTGLSLNESSKTTGWKWSGGSTPVGLSEFGDPVNGSTNYRLCIYDTYAAAPSDLAFGIMVTAGG